MTWRRSTSNAVLPAGRAAGRKCPSQHEQAAAAAGVETVARSIPDPDRQAQVQALSAVASALAAREDTRQARRVASVACAFGRWTTALGLVLSLEPSAVSVLTDLQLSAAKV